MSTEVLDELKLLSESLTDEEKMRLANHLFDKIRKGQLVRPEGTKTKGDAGTLDPERRLERKWLLQHGREFEGQWVALNGDCLLSHGTDGRVVLSEARRAGVAVPFVVRVEKAAELPFGGW